MRWYTPGIEGLNRNAYAGLNRAGNYHLAAFNQGYETDTTVLPTVERTCSSLIDEGPCRAPYVHLCLQCVVEDERTCEP